MKLDLLDNGILSAFVYLTDYEGGDKVQSMYLLDMLENSPFPNLWRDECSADWWGLKKLFQLAIRGSSHHHQDNDEHSLE